MSSIEFTLNGRSVSCPAGFAVAGALVALGCRTTRIAPRTRLPRFYFCGMGICGECVVEIDGRAGVRSCMTAVRPGMRVVTGDGFAPLRAKGSAS